MSKRRAVHDDIGSALLGPQPVHRDVERRDFTVRLVFTRSLALALQDETREAVRSAIEAVVPADASIELPALPEGHIYLAQPRNETPNGKRQWLRTEIGVEYLGAVPRGLKGKVREAVRAVFVAERSRE